MKKRELEERLGALEKILIDNKPLVNAFRVESCTDCQVEIEKKYFLIAVIRDKMIKIREKPLQPCLSCHHWKKDCSGAGAGS